MFRAWNSPYSSNFDCEYLEIYSFYAIDPNFAGHHRPFTSLWTNMNPTAMTDVLIERITSNGRK